MELNENAGILSLEHYYPFGRTACWASNNALGAKYKSIRYSGKERDVTGFYYYGFRYYAPWLQR
ncbi:RHS repeat-associated core domain-containing protein [Pseudomonas sp. NPDC088885]|uniref:RHS repeat-associated core domain-containing protein n=1 Tax=Pseudomonas sp. NPDC088885 TaxID=3364457 RepID=UPI00380322D9